MQQARRPVFILTGFLGAGKTTLLNQMLQKEAWADTLVIVNEFGEISLDHHLIENSSDTILELSNGCLCCSVRGELVDTLNTLDIARFKQVIIETTGLADPLPIIQSLMMEQRLASLYEPAGVVTIVDAMAGVEGLEKYPEAMKQIVLADVIVLTKRDLAKGDYEGLSKAIKGLNGWAQLIDDPLLLTPQQIMNCVPQDKILPSKTDQNHTQHYRSILLESERVMNVQAMNELLQQLVHALGENLLRLKGLVKTLECPETPLLVQISGGFIHAFEPLEKWPDGIETTQLIVITNLGDAALVQTIFNAFTGQVEIDSPDAAALIDNPLSIPGMG